MLLECFLENNFEQLIVWIDSDELNYLWGGPAYQFPLTADQIQEHCTKPEVHPFMFTVNGKPAGFVELYQVSDSECRICRVFISPTFRGKNLGTEMLKLLVMKAKEQYKCQLLTLGVFSHNQAAILCYEKLGFISFTVEKNSREFNGESWDLIRMQKSYNTYEPSASQ